MATLLLGETAEVYYTTLKQTASRKTPEDFVNSLRVDSILSDANFYIIKDANEEISGFEGFSGQNRDNFQFVPNSGRVPEFGTFWHHFHIVIFSEDSKLC